MLAVAAAAVAALELPALSGALSSPTPWNGANPFNCTIQNAGFGPTGPDPGADPYCVRFDKTHQNISQLGVADFLLKEPARVAVASPKCFYFQEDHWRGSVVQSDGKTVIYEFEGHYFFNKATGDGGAWVTGFTLAGQTLDPTELPGFPPGYGGDFGPGTGGFITHNDVPTDPKCVALAKQHPGQVYAPNRGARCVPRSGVVKRHALGPVSLGERDSKVRAELGPPQSVNRGFMRYCVDRGGALFVGQRGDRSGTFGSNGRTRTVMVLTTSSGFVLRGARGRTIHVGSAARAVRRAFPHFRVLGRSHRVEALLLGRTLAAGLRHGRVKFLAVYSPRAIRGHSRLLGYLRRAR